MKQLREKIAVQENMGIIDRSLRLFFGLLLLVPIIVVIQIVEPRLAMVHHAGLLVPLFHRHVGLGSGLCRAESQDLRHIGQEPLRHP